MMHLVLRATEKCNSNCVYCGTRSAARRRSMTPELLERVLDRANEYLAADGERRLELLWHGGEPLLRGTAFFEAAASWQDTRCPDTKARIRHGLQTNLTCLTEELAALFRRLGLSSIGTSFDPEPHMRGPGKTVDSEKYNRQFLKGLRIVEREGWDWGLLYVVTQKSLPRALEVFFFLTNLRLSGPVSFNPILVDNAACRHLEISPREFAVFLGTIFPVWWRYRHRYPDIEPFSSLVRDLQRPRREGRPGPDPQGDPFINVAPDGEASPCRRIADPDARRYGNIADRPLAAIAEEIRQDQERDERQALQDESCAGCRLWDICRGGLIPDAFSQNKGRFGPDEWCEAKRCFIDQYVEPLTGARDEP